MDWTHYRGGAGFNFEHPAGWRVAMTPLPSCTVTSPDGLCMALIQPLPPRAGMPPADVILNGQFPTANLFPGARPVDVTTPAPNSAQGTLQYTATDRSPARAQLVFVDHGNMGMLCAIGAPERLFASVEPVLWRIVKSQLESRQPAAPPGVVRGQLARWHLHPQ